MAINEEMSAAMRELRESQRALDECELDKKSLILPGREVYTLTATDIAALKRARVAWEAYADLARRRWDLGDGDF